MSTTWEQLDNDEQTLLEIMRQYRYEPQRPDGPYERRNEAGAWGSGLMPHDSVSPPVLAFGFGDRGDDGLALRTAITKLMDRGLICSGWFNRRCFDLTEEGKRLVLEHAGKVLGKRTGRPPGPANVKEAEGDKRILAAWDSGRYTDYQDLASALRKTRLEVEHAIGRERKRQSRRASQ